MNVDDLLQAGRKIWGDDKLTLPEILLRLGVTTGDLHRLARDQAEGKTIDENEVKKELGNIIFSTIRWCDDLGYTPAECVALAQAAQARYKQQLG